MLSTGKYAANSNYVPRTVSTQAACIRRMGEYGIRRIRVPWCPSIHLIKKNVAGLTLQILAHRRAADVPGFLPCLGLAQAGRNSTASFCNELVYAARASRPDIELVVHPGITTPDLESCYPGWHFDWSCERNALLSTQFAEAVNANGYVFFAPAGGSHAQEHLGRKAELNDT
jgi:hypothetical protein